MSGADEFRRQQSKLIQLFKTAEMRTCHDCDRRVKISAWFILACLIGSTLPFQAANTLFSVGAAAGALLLAIFRISSGIRIGARLLTTLALAATLSLVTGCSPLLAGPDEDILAFCRNVQKDGGACKVGSASGLRIFGIPIRQASIQSAQAAAGITESRGVEIINSYGLICMTQVSVYGE